jgi:hypothetical protein
VVGPPRDKPDYHVHIHPQAETGGGRQNEGKVSPESNTWSIFQKNPASADKGPRKKTLAPYLKAIVAKARRSFGLAIESVTEAQFRTYCDGIDFRASSAATREDRRHRRRDPAADAAGLEARGTAGLRNGCAAIAGAARPTPHLARTCHSAARKGAARQPHQGVACEPRHHGF